MTAVIAAEVNGGVGSYHGPIELDIIAKLVIASNILWVLIVNITKASILTQYLRIFSGRAIRAACFAFLVLLLPAVSWAVFRGIFLCTPTVKLWDPTLPGHCSSARAYWLSVAVIDVGLGFLILILPLPAITSLHLPRKEKITLVLAFTLGFFVCIASLVRLLTVYITSRQGNTVAAGVWAIIWSAVEANVGIICASLLALKPLLNHLYPRLLEHNEPPKHSMRLPMIDTLAEDIWRDKSMMVLPSSFSGSLRPSTQESKDSSLVSPGTVGKRPSASFTRAGGSGSFDEFGGELECGRRMTAHQRKPTLTFLDMLREDGDEEMGAEIETGRKGSWFQEQF